MGVVGPALISADTNKMDQLSLDQKAINQKLLDDFDTFKEANNSFIRNYIADSKIEYNKLFNTISNVQQVISDKIEDTSNTIFNTSSYFSGINKTAGQVYSFPDVNMPESH